jgi:Holliday junction DNA helicase RuvA
MIALLRGRLHRKTGDALIIDVAGVGYEVHAPLSTASCLPETGEEICLHIHTHVREDAFSLFGFLTEAEKELFLLLMGVSGIGPRLAMAVLSSLSVADIANALQSNDDTRLCTIPGIGKKTAARMVLELKDKIACVAVPPRQQGLPGAGAAIDEDALSALVNLGYKRSPAEEALRKVRQEKPGLSLETLIREALAVLTKR